MVTYDEHAEHAISWVDLAAVDLDAATAFYAGLFGWDSFNDGETPYTIYLSGEHAVAGAMELTPEMGEMPPVWSVYVNVVDADATLAAATAAGGAIFQEPFDIPDGGRIAVVADPAGAVICLFEGQGDSGMKVMDEVGAPCWFDCMSRDAAASIAFYETVFGWTSETMDMGDMQYTVFSNNGAPTAGTMAMPPMVPAEVPSHWQVNFVVADADVAAAYVADNGGTVTMPPNDTPFGRAAGMMDPWGAVFSVIDRSTAE